MLEIAPESLKAKLRQELSALGQSNPSIEGLTALALDSK